VRLWEVWNPGLLLLPGPAAEKASSSQHYKKNTEKSENFPEICQKPSCHISGFRYRIIVSFFPGVEHV
jgi:hypothetical protein